MRQALRQTLPAALIGVLALLFTQIPAALAESEGALLPYQVAYAATLNGMDIDAKRELRVNGNRYEIITSAKNLLGSITEEGTFSLDEQGVIVDHGYEYERNIIGMKKTEELSYDRTAGVANYEEKKKKRQVKLDGNYLNRLSYQVQLQRDLSNGQTTLQYQVIARGRLKDYNFEILDEETLDTPLGPFKTIKVKRVREDDDRQTIMWFAPELNYLLIQLWQKEEDGDDHKLVIKSGTINRQPIINGDNHS